MTNNLKVVDVLQTVIYPRLSAEMIFADLKNIKSAQGKGIVADCPVCGKPGHFFCYDHSIVGYCHAGTCSISRNGKGLSWWAHTQERFGLTNNKQVLFKLAGMARVQIPEAVVSRRDTVSVHDGGEEMNVNVQIVELLMDAEMQLRNKNYWSIANAAEKIRCVALKEANRIEQGGVPTKS